VDATARSSLVIATSSPPHITFHVRPKSKITVTSMNATGMRQQAAWWHRIQATLIRSSAAATSPTRNRTALPSLKNGIRPDMRHE